MTPIVGREKKESTMKTLSAILFGMGVAQAQAVTPGTQNFCGSAPCIVDMAISCQALVEEYDFQGSCCAMEDIPAIRGCRIEVSAAGNCFWTPRCGECDLSAKCNFVYSTTASTACPTSKYDPFDQTLKATCPPTPAPLAPTDFPTPLPSEASSLGFAVAAVGVVSSAFLIA